MIFIFGPAGAGKSTQGRMLAERMGAEWRSVGEICREKFHEYTENGEMVPEGELAREVKAEIDRVVASGSDLVFDGQPWSPEGADKALEMGMFNGVEAVIVLDVSKEELLKRLSKRGREDDRAEVWEKKIEMFEGRIAKFLEPLEAAGLEIIYVDGEGTPEEVCQRILEEIEAGEV